MSDARSNFEAARKGISSGGLARRVSSPTGLSM